MLQDCSASVIKLLMTVIKARPCGSVNDYNCAISSNCPLLHHIQEPETKKNIGSWLQPAKRAEAEGDIINIFTIASGHMYERLQKIMVLSVLRHTKAKVKFWLIKNYMSPDMKAFMPIMAKQHGFEVCP
jgi:hypothetical protein